jgi:signal transduction histidine kinase
MSDLNDEAPAGMDPGVFRASQIAATQRIIPVTMTGNLLAGGIFAGMAWDELNRSMILIWLAVLALPSLYLLALALAQRGKLPHTVTTGTIRRAEIYAIALAVAWAALPALFIPDASSNLRLLIIAMVFAACGSGAFALARIPTAGIIFTVMLCAAMSVATLQVGGSLGFVFGLMSLFYGVMMVASILTTHGNAVERAAYAADLERQREIITLLLNDFERGTSDWLWETNAKRELTYFSNRMPRVLHRKPDDLNGRRLLDLVGGNDGLAGWQELEQLIGSREMITDLTLEVKIEGAPRWWMLSGKPLFDAKGAFDGYRYVGRDLTAERQSHAELLRAKEAAEAMSAAKSEFLAVMSHELRTPLHAIIGFAELLAAGPSGNTKPSDQVEFAGTILESAERLRGIVDDILEVTRFEQGSTTLAEQTGDAVELAEVAVKMCRYLAHANNVEITLQYGRNAEISGDFPRLKKVLLNLVSNAVKFSPQGGTVDVSLNEDRNGGLVISVQDQGIGMQPTDIAKVFEPFVQLDKGHGRKFGGLGLGLAIARRIARLHGGDVTLLSTPGKGTLAKLSLPASRIAWHQGARNRAVA